jgi:hypothetical protein
MGDTKWISVKDRLPKVLGPSVLLYADFGYVSDSYKIGFLVTRGRKPAWNIDGQFKNWPTHWQPLPAPPEANQ